MQSKYANADYGFSWYQFFPEKSVIQEKFLKCQFWVQCPKSQAWDHPSHFIYNRMLHVN